MLFFNEKINYCEDLIWTKTLLDHVQEIEFCDKLVYYYRITPNSITTQLYFREVFIKNSIMVLSEIQNNRILLKERDKNDIVICMIRTLIMLKAPLYEKKKFVQFLENEKYYPYPIPKRSPFKILRINKLLSIKTTFRDFVVANIGFFLCHKIILNFVLFLRNLTLCKSEKMSNKNFEVSEFEKLYYKGSD